MGGERVIVVPCVSLMCYISSVKVLKRGLSEITLVHFIIWDKIVNPGMPTEVSLAEVSRHSKPKFLNKIYFKIYPFLRLRTCKSCLFL